jgi:hypothetical protein
MSSPRIASWPAPGSTPVVLPICGMADWGIGHPLDAEEAVLMRILSESCRRLGPEKAPLVVPPLRFAFGADPSCAFAVDQPTAHALIEEVSASVAAAGFRKIVLLNSSPWNEELCSAAARDLRVSRGLHLFHIHLSALELDLHPSRSRSRGRFQTLATFVLGQEPEEAVANPSPARWGQECVTPLAGPAATLAAAASEGAEILSAAAGRLATLLGEIRDRAPLAAKLTPP